ncbi:MAG TPA: single-stranded-DNA-specific exonuclease RecJ [Bacteroidia bacterium]|nr:single-stranded-DNA-specific exonuclease RecJ [Bacteroidia bacterium]HQF27455.1 single-stranded-DNA-specific exonuclease RecJ [Bacteroidia bacterium]
MEKRWVLKPQGDADAVTRLAAELRINRILVNLLVQRGITTYEEARRFFRPSLDMLHDPFLMKDMDKAIDRINTAVENKEKVMVYGDYDVDGTTAVSLVYTFLKSLSGDIAHYIPDRYKEGYGISKQGIDFAKENGYTLIIALDCGIKSVDKIDYANSLGVDFIICDHHRPGAEIPNAVAVLDPKRNDCPYPYKELSGCGIGFKLVQAFAQQNEMPFSQLEQYLDLVAISIAADIVPITGENRILAYYGLQRLNREPRPGIKAILELSGFKRDELTINDIVFTIAPRINAAGRIESGTKAVELLISRNEDLAGFLGDDINDQNNTRKNLDQLITDQALQQIEDNEDFKNRKSTVLYNPEWHKGVIGIVASRLTDRYYRPTIVLTKSNGMVSGSARSVKDFDVYNAIESCSDLLEQFGGHMYAAGLTMREENVDAFREKFEAIVSTTIEEKMLTREIEIDAELSLTDITCSFYNILKQFAPFGPGNLSPIFRSSGVRDNGRGRVVGNNHLKLTLTQEGNQPGVYDGIAFQLGHHHPMVEQQEAFDVVYHIEENNFNNRITLQLNIKDLKFVRERDFAL